MGNTQGDGKSKVSATRANNPEPGLGRGVQRITSNAFLYYHLANEPITDQYDLKEKLGEPGGYGYAQVAIKKKTKEKFAVKVINKVKFHRDHDSKRDMFYREMQIMKELDHPNVIKGYDMFEDDQNLYLVMELCRGGELFDVLNSRFQNNQTFSEVDASGILRQICMGIKHLHDNKIAHCDLKPDNFLFKDKDHKVIKIIDFNLAKYTKNLEYLDATCGTKYYMAPEVLNQKFTYHCDMWSFGVVMYLMLFGRPPFQGKNYQSIQKKIKAGFTPAVQTGKGPWFPQDIPVSREAKDLIAGLLDSNFSTRLTAAEALEHPWLRGEAPNTPMVTNVVNNLASFMATSSFKTQLLRLMARDFSDPELDDLKSCFEMIDTNGDGFLTISELKAALLEAGVSQTATGDMQKLLEMANVRAEGKISYEELVMSSINKRLIAKEERLHELFVQLDLNKTGYLTANEIETVIGAQQDVSALIAEVDTQGDGRIDYQEFLAMFMKSDITTVQRRLSVRERARSTTRVGAPSRPELPKLNSIAEVEEGSDQSTGRPFDVKVIIEGGNAMAEAEKLLKRQDNSELFEARSQLAEYQISLTKQINELQARQKSVLSFVNQIDETIAKQSGAQSIPSQIDGTLA